MNDRENFGHEAADIAGALNQIASSYIAAAATRDAVATSMIALACTVIAQDAGPVSGAAYLREIAATMDGTSKPERKATEAETDAYREMKHHAEVAQRQTERATAIIRAVKAKMSTVLTLLADPRHHLQNRLDGVSFFFNDLPASDADDARFGGFRKNAPVADKPD
jgi:hypothetical protein